MEEINSFFDHTPMDGVSYIIIQHLSPDFKSRMVELLSRHSKLEVKEAKHGMPVACNEVYLIPNDKYMVIENNQLLLTEKERSRPPHLTINTFFSSLAANSGENAIGIIFSGLGSDGTEGIREIKKQGGMVMARNPETAEFGSMPSNAIASGLVDFILEPEAMPLAIEECCDLTIYADRNKIAQVLTNFLTNAIKYSPNEKPIEVSCKTVEHMLQVSVRDDGIGIELQDQQKLFDRYYRIENKNTKGVSGFGLGLYLCSEIIQRHQGRVWVESKVGEGSTFYFNLPLKEEV